MEKYVIDLLKAWAVLGPLAVGVASALWSRKVQLEDRTYEKEQRALARKEANEDKESEFSRARIETELKELRSAASEFLFYAGEFVDSGADLCRINPPDGASDRHGTARENLNRSAHHFALIAPEDLGECAVALHNSASVFLNGRIKTEAELSQKAKDYSAAKAKFMQAAKKIIGARIEA